MVRLGIQSMSGRKRFFVEKIDGDTAVLDGGEFIHAKTVQRVDIGSEIILLDGSGKEYGAIVTKIERHSLSAHIVSVADGDREPKTDICLLFGALKGDKNELVVQKATELGVGKIGIFSSEYCAAFINENKLERINKVAREASKQCMRSKTPEIAYFSDFKEALRSASDYKNKLFACEFAKSSQTDLLTLKGSTAIVVGSEGGFSEREAELASGENFSFISLGKRILRAETASIALLSAVAFVLGELR